MAKKACRKKGAIHVKFKRNIMRMHSRDTTHEIPAQKKSGTSEPPRLVLQRPRLFRPIGLQKDGVIRYDWLKITQLCPFVADSLSHTEEDFTEFEPMTMQSQIFRPFDWITTCRALKRRRLLLLKCSCHQMNCRFTYDTHGRSLHVRHTKK